MTEGSGNGGILLLLHAADDLRFWQERAARQGARTESPEPGTAWPSGPWMLVVADRVGGQPLSEALLQKPDCLPEIEPGGTILFWDQSATDLQSPNGIPVISIQPDRSAPDPLIDWILAAAAERQRAADWLQRLREARQGAHLGAITHAIVHNQNNLLGIVTGYLDLIRSDPDLPPQSRQRIAQIHKTVTRMVEISRRLTRMATQEQFHLRRYSIGDLIETTLGRFRAEYPQTSAAAIEPAIEDPAAAVETNREVFEESLGKLLINAWESYSGSRPSERRHIGLKVEQRPAPSEVAGPCLEITISDHGRGLDPAVAREAFEPFVTTKLEPGAGMGLTAARRSIRNIGGDIRLVRNPEGGTDAIITHPCPPEPEELT